MVGIGGDDSVQPRHGARPFANGPIPYPGNRTLDAGQISQLYCRERVRRGKQSTYFTYDVNAAIEGQKEQKIVSGLDESEQALFIEQEIERFLKIPDTYVKGEVGRA